jgi:hypothetical protein
MTGGDSPDPGMRPRDQGIVAPGTTADIPRRPAGLYVVGEDAGTVADGIDEAERDWWRQRPDIDVSSYGIVTRIGHIGHHLRHSCRQAIWRSRAAGTRAGRRVRRPRERDS